MKTKIINEALGRSYQDVTYTCLLSMGDHKLRVRINSNAYAFQSFAVIERWNGERWHNVASIHHSNMTTQSALCYMPASKPATIVDFKGDAEALIKLASNILK